MSILRVGTSTLDLFPGTQIRILRNNPLFVDEILNGDYTLPFRIPATEKNRSILGWLHTPESLTAVDPEYDAEYEDAGIFIFKGKLVAKKANASEYEAYLLIGISELASIKEKNLQELDYGGYNNILGSSFFQFIKWKFVPNGISHTITMMMGYVTGIGQCTPYNYIAGTSANDVLNDLKAIMDAQLIADGGYEGVSSRTLTITVVADEMLITASWAGTNPLLRALPIFGTAGWTIVDQATGGDALVVPLWESIMNATISGSPDDKDFIFFPVKNTGSGMIDKYTLAEIPILYMNYYNCGTGSFDLSFKETSGGMRSIRTTISPFLKMLFVLRKIFQTVNLKYTGTFTLDSEIKNICLFTNYSFNYLQRVNFGYDGHYPDGYDLKHCAPNATVADFLGFIKKTFCLIYLPNYAHKNIELVTFEELFTSNEVVDWNAPGKVQPNPEVKFDQHKTGFTLQFEFDTADEYLSSRMPSMEGKIRMEDRANYTDLALYYVLVEPNPPKNIVVFVLSERRFYYPKYELDGTYSFVFFSEELQPKITGDGSELVNTGADSPVNESNWDDRDPGVVWQLPIVAQKIEQMEMDAEDIEKTAIRPLFYRGMQDTNGHTYQYPLGSYNDYAYLGPLTSANYALTFEGAKGLYEVFWKKYITWRCSAKEVEFVVNLSASEFSNIDLKKKYFINGSYYFIKAIDITLPVTAPCKVTLVRV